MLLIKKVNKKNKKTEQKDSDKVGTFNINENLLCKFFSMLNYPTFQIDTYGLSRGVYCSIINMYPTPPIYVLYSLQGQFIGFQNFTLFLN